MAKEAPEDGSRFMRAPGIRFWSWRACDSIPDTELEKTALTGSLAAGLLTTSSCAILPGCEVRSFCLRRFLPSRQSGTEAIINKRHRDHHRAQNNARQNPVRRRYLSGIEEQHLKESNEQKADRRTSIHLAPPPNADKHQARSKNAP